MRRLVAMLGLLVACPGDPQAPDLYTPWISDDLASTADFAAPDLALTVDELMLALAKARCQYDARCGWRAASAEQACEDAAAAGLAAYPPAYSRIEAVAAGRLALDVVAARACVDAWATAGCGLVDRALADGTCKAYVAQRAIGQSCLASGECVGGYCQGSLQEGCGGTCAAWIANADACDPASSLCDAARSFCAAGSRTCVALVGLGGACGADAWCRRGLVCVDDAPADGGATGFCRASGALGDPCADYGLGFSSCGAGLYCDSSGARPFACVARKGSGEVCAALGVCADGLDCIGLDLTVNPIVEGLCGAFRDVGAGCDATLADPGCARDLRCRAASSTCVVAGAVNDDCSASNFCRDHLYCDAAGKCSAAVALGAACVPPATATDPDPCAAGACDPATTTCALLCR